MTAPHAIASAHVADCDECRRQIQIAIADEEADRG